MRREGAGKMLEQYFKTRKEFDEYLDQTYDSDKFEKGFEQFLNKLATETTH